MKLLLIFFIFAFGCTTTSKKPLRPKQSVAKHENLSLDQIVAEDHLPATKTGPAPAKKKSEPRNASKQKVASCQKLYDRFVFPYRNLAKALPKSSNAKPTTASHAVGLLDRSSCFKKSQRRHVIKTILAATDQHNQRVAIILPLTGPSATLSKHILDGFKASFAEAGLPFERHVIIKDSGGAPELVEQKLAEAILIDQASFIIGGLTRQEGQLLAKWAEPLFVPMLLFAQDDSLTADNGFAFRVYPDEKRLSFTLADTAHKNNLRRVAILRPANKKSDHLVEYFRQRVQENQGTIVHDLVYQPNDYDSMDFVTRELFQLDISKRGDEYRRAFHNARRRAKAAGMPFNARNIVIDPIVEFDAVFVPDDFRIVRHFTKLFKYHGVRQIPMLGNHEWRSPALIQPPDEFLDGSFFADFIGSYTKLPATIGAPTLNSPYFVRADQVLPVDFRMIGYRTAYLAKMAISARVAKRRHLAPFFEKLPSKEAFGPGLVFDRDHAANWPTYVFRVGNGVIALEETLTSAKAFSPASKHTSLFGNPKRR